MKKEREKAHEREGWRDRETKCAKEERESQNRATEKKLPMGKTGAVLPGPSF